MSSENDKDADGEDAPPGIPGGIGDRPKWVMIAGFCCLGVLILFMMGLIVASLGGHEVPCGSRFLVVALFAAVGGAAAGFLGGWAVAEGKVPFGKNSPVQFGVGGGIGVLVLLMIIGNQVFACADGNDPSMEIFSAYSAGSVAGQENLRVTFRVYHAPADSTLALEYSPDGEFKTVSRSRIDDASVGSTVMPVPPQVAGKQAAVQLMLLNAKGRELARTKSFPVDHSSAEAEGKKP